jgi:hypothetical protein
MNFIYTGATGQLHEEPLRCLSFSAVGCLAAGG